MHNQVVDEQGQIWWRDTVIPDGHFTPDDCVGGHLAACFSAADDRGYIARKTRHETHR